MDNEHVEPPVEEMHHRQITLADGRYMIFYTFGEQGHDSANAQPVGKSKPADVVTNQEKNDV